MRGHNHLKVERAGTFLPQGFGLGHYGLNQCGAYKIMGGDDEGKHGAKSWFVSLSGHESTTKGLILAS